MKTKLLFICALLFAMSQTFAQVYMFEPFDYSPIGNSLLSPAVNTNSGTNTTWNNYTAGSPEDMLIATQPGWALGQAFDLNPQGNAVNWKGGGEDGELKFATEASPVNSGSIYLSFFIEVIGWDTTTGGNSPAIYRHTGFGINDAGNNGSSLFFGPGTAANTFQLGYGNSDSQNTSNPDVVFIPTDYTYVDIGTDADNANAKQFFIVIKYTFDGNGNGAMWVNPAVNTTEPTPDITHTATNKVRSAFISVLLQASSNARTPDATVDEIRVAGTWEEATGQAPPLSVSKNELDSKIKMYPNPAKDYIQIESKDIQIASVEMYSLVGKKLISQKSLANDRLDISALSSGIYLLKVNAEEGGSLTRKIVVE
jgi:hypothetical protein